MKDLDGLYYRLIGPYAESFFRVRSTRDRFGIDLNNLWKYLATRFMQKKNETKKLSKNRVHPEQSETEKKAVKAVEMNPIQNLLESYYASKTFDNEEMLRDIFLWAVISGHAEMAFILLLQVKSRIIASLIAAGIARRFRFTQSGYLDRLHKFQKQSKDYELFAKSCIDDCYQRNERLACQLLLRQIPSFGNVTCMQVIYI